MAASSPIPIDGIELRPSSAMAGAKKAVRFGDGPIYLSPAMWELVSKAESEGELRAVLAAIHVVNMPAMPSLYDPLPMSIQPTTNFGPI